MCELHLYWCPGCGMRWQKRKRLASCEGSDQTSKCPESLCMYVGNPKKPRRGECEKCNSMREAIEGFSEGLYFV
ncbi:hypothetical protein BDP81DRAFT_315522 [Colletotrichum phormii]|uniref:Uncharacterized protein n=1 Tax=Colletotrichum phormii TaxID=359342 RepID=A0AAI9ZW95_9PEZI|nr:uncharacterized protein BDP81DRAFT_315522 [Colletotrichum phormii]KAK1638985.1 hypothetical protein BDP81DRAFT_315522 [Colletotrichum phormii]